MTSRPIFVIAIALITTMTGCGDSSPKTLGTDARTDAPGVVVDAAAGPEVPIDVKSDVGLEAAVVPDAPAGSKNDVGLEAAAAPDAPGGVDSTKDLALDGVAPLDTSAVDTSKRDVGQDLVAAIDATVDVSASIDTQVIEAGEWNCGCAADELCVQFYDGTCRRMSLVCAKDSLQCRGSAAPACDASLCGNYRDGGAPIRFTHNGPPCPGEVAGSYGCYGI